MEYILADKMKITKPIIFLCGPYYDKNNPEDRRNILKETIHEVYKVQKQKVLPLIVDLFLTEKNLDVQEYSVQLFEEICAAVSGQTHIFLDTMSAATELGIFANSAYANRIIVYIPKKSDVFNKGNVGYFVREAVLKKPNCNIKTIEYRPRIIKMAYSSVFTAEHFAFNDNRIPDIIKCVIEREAAGGAISSNVPIRYIEAPGFSPEPNCITYEYSDKNLSIRLSIKLLFYIVTSILHQEIPNIVKRGMKSVDAAVENNIIDNSLSAITNSVSFSLGKEAKEYTSINVTTIVNERIETVIKHIIKFNLLYYNESQFGAHQLIDTLSYSSIKADIKNHPNVIFPLSDNEEKLVDRVITNNDSCYETIIVKKGKKERKIVKYSDSEDGAVARSIHNSLNSMLRERYTPAECSYAYHKGSSIKKCVTQHLNSRGFIKFDIKNFFGSIKKQKLITKMINEYSIDEHYVSVLDKVVSTCFFDDELPLGLVASPIISDFYLKAFDAKMRDFCSDKQLTYTRYADDIMLSSKEVFDKTSSEQIENMVRSFLKDDGLNLNDDKSCCVNFGVGANFVKYIGISIVEGEGNNPNYLSVGKKYIFDLAKEYMKYDELRKQEMVMEEGVEKEELSKQIFYFRAELIGKIDFIRQIEGKRGIERLHTRLRKFFPQLDIESL